MLDGLHWAHAEATTISNTFHLVQHRNLRIPWRPKRQLWEMIAETDWQFYKIIPLMMIGLRLEDEGVFNMCAFVTHAVSDETSCQNDHLNFHWCSSFLLLIWNDAAFYLLVQSSSAENGHVESLRQSWQQLQGPVLLFDPQTSAECWAPSGESLCGKRETTEIYAVQPHFMILMTPRVMNAFELSFIFKLSGLKQIRLEWHRTFIALLLCFLL